MLLRGLLLTLTLPLWPAAGAALALVDTASDAAAGATAAARGAAANGCAAGGVADGGAASVAGGGVRWRFGDRESAVASTSAGVDGGRPADRDAGGCGDVPGRGRLEAALRSVRPVGTASTAAADGARAGVGVGVGVGAAGVEACDTDAVGAFVTAGVAGLFARRETGADLGAGVDKAPTRSADDGGWRTCCCCCCCWWWCSCVATGGRRDGAE